MQGRKKEEEWQAHVLYARMFGDIGVSIESEFARGANEKGIDACRAGLDSFDMFSDGLGGTDIR